MRRSMRRGERRGSGDSRVFESLLSFCDRGRGEAERGYMLVYHPNSVVTLCSSLPYLFSLRVILVDFFCFLPSVAFSEGPFHWCIL